MINIVTSLFGLGVSREVQSNRPLQSGALPWRLGRGKKAQVLLVTGRRSGRWMIPKGWPKAGKSLADSAAEEAFEEAGIKGTIDPKPFGQFRHVKQHLLFGNLEVEIVVHPLAVERELRNWPERGERTRKWFGLKEAAEKVDSEDLRSLIVEFGDLMRAAKRKRAKA